MQPTQPTSLPFDIVILPSNELTRTALQLSSELQPRGTHFTLDNAACYAHASLYMVQLKVADLPEVQAALAAVASQATPLDLLADQYNQSYGFLDAEYQLTDLLARLQRAVITAVNPLRDGLREKDKPRLLRAQGQAKENYEKFGFPSVGDLFRPHLTITRFTSQEPIDVNGLPDIQLFNGQFVSLGLFEMGDNGTCVRQIATLPLS